MQDTPDGSVPQLVVIPDRLELAVGELIHTSDDAQMLFSTLRRRILEHAKSPGTRESEKLAKLKDQLRELGRLVLEWDPQDNRRQRVEGARDLCSEVAETYDDLLGDTMEYGTIYVLLRGLGYALEP